MGNAAIKNNSSARKQKRAKQRQTRQNILADNVYIIKKQKPLPQEEKKVNEYLHLTAEVQRREKELAVLQKEYNATFAKVLQRNSKLKSLLKSIDKMERALEKAESKTEGFIENLFNLMKKKFYQGLKFRMQFEFKKAGCAYTKVFKDLIELDLIEEEMLYEVIAKHTSRKQRLTLKLNDDFLKNETLD